MRRKSEELPSPARPDHHELVRAGAAGTWWERGDGLSVRLAAPESRPVVQRERVSLIAVLLALAAAGRDER